MRHEGSLTAIRTRACHLVLLVQEGDERGLLDAIGLLAEERGRGGFSPHLVVGELLDAIVTMISARLTLIDADAEDPLFALDIRDPAAAAEVGIDELRPPLRAAIRALLAELNGHPAEACFQVELALSGGDFESTLEVVSYALLWTVGMLEWCASVGGTVPEWLVDAVATA